MSDLSFLGTGIKFPFQFSLVSGGVTQSSSTTTSSGIAHVAQSIYQIILTAIGERVGRRKWGSRVNSLLLRPQNTAAFIDAMRVAVENHEKRAFIPINGIESEEGGITGQVIISVTFEIIGTNVVGNMVFPFYLQTDAASPPAIGFVSSLLQAS